MATCTTFCPAKHFKSIKHILVLNLFKSLSCRSGYEMHQSFLIDTKNNIKDGNTMFYLHGVCVCVCGDVCSVGPLFPHLQPIKLITEILIEKETFRPSWNGNFCLGILHDAS